VVFISFVDGFLVSVFICVSVIFSEKVLVVEGVNCIVVMGLFGLV